MKQSGDQLLHGPHEGFFTGGELSVEGRPRNGERHSEWKYYDRCRDKGAGPLRCRVDGQCSRINFLQETEMKYMLLIYDDEVVFDKIAKEEQQQILAESVPAGGRNLGLAKYVGFGELLRR